MTKTIDSKEQLLGIINYILWNYDVNASNISFAEPKAYVDELANTWIVSIQYTLEIHKGNNADDPTIRTDDRQVRDEHKFILLKTETFRQLTKYVEDICEEIAKIKNKILI